MAGKKNVDKESGSWVADVERYSRQIWLAGLGAYSKVSKDGSKLFDNLVQDGEKAEKKVKGGVDKQFDGVRSSAKSAKSRVDEVRGLALGKWGELEEAFDKRLNSAISRLGVPSRLEVKQLNAKVEQLTAQLEKLTGVSAASVKTAAKPAPRAAAKPAVKPAAKVAAKAPVKAAGAATKAPAKAPLKAPAKAAAKPATAAKPAAKKPAASKPVVKKPVAAKPAAAPAAPAPATPASAETGSAATPLV